jgi:hypothetical protein
MQHAQVPDSAAAGPRGGCIHANTYNTGWLHTRQYIQYRMAPQGGPTPIGRRRPRQQRGLDRRRKTRNSGAEMRARVQGMYKTCTRCVQDVYGAEMRAQRRRGKGGVEDREMPTPSVHSSRLGAQTREMDWVHRRGRWTGCTDEGDGEMGLMHTTRSAQDTRDAQQASPGCAWAPVAP